MFDFITMISSGVAAMIDFPWCVVKRNPVCVIRRLVVDQNCISSLVD